MAQLTNSYGEASEAKLPLEQIRRQNNRAPQLKQARTGPDNKAPVRMNRGDFATALHPRGALMAVAGDKNSREYIIIPRNSVQNLGTLFGTGLPTVDSFPNDEDYGWWIDETAGKAYWSINVGGTIFYTTSTVGGISFAEISGTITDAQHGNLGRQTGGNPHHTNATTTQPGFLSTTFFDRLNTATSAATASTLVLRNATGGANFADTVVVVDLNASGSGLFNSLNATTSSDADTFNATTNYSVQNTQVVGPQDTGWTAPTATQSKAGFGNGATATEIEQNLSAVINALMSHGLLGS